MNLWLIYGWYTVRDTVSLDTVPLTLLNAALLRPAHLVMKIVDKIKASMDAGETFFSFEYFPPRTEEVYPRYSGGPFPRALP